MNAYAVGTLPLVHDTRAEIPQALQPWFSDNPGGAGKAKLNAECMEYFVIHGPQVGYYLEQKKSWYICKAKDEEFTMQVFDEKGLTIQYSRERKYPEGFIGNSDSKEDWLHEKLADWADAVKILAKTAVQYLQTAYVGFVFCLQVE